MFVQSNIGWFILKSLRRKVFISYYFTFYSMYKFWFVLGFVFSFFDVLLAMYFEWFSNNFWMGFATYSFCSVALLIIFKKKKYDNN